MATAQILARILWVKAQTANTSVLGAAVVRTDRKSLKGQSHCECAANLPHLSLFEVCGLRIFQLSMLQELYTMTDLLLVDVVISRARYRQM